MSRKQIVVLAALWLGWAGAGWGEEVAPFRIVPLPPLRIAGQASRAHTQGLELVASDYYVSARQEDGHPARALLLRTRPSRWVTYSHFLKAPTDLVVSSLPQYDSVELGREGMTISRGQVYFMPEDLGQTNRIFTTGVGTMKRFRLSPSTKP